MKEMTPIDVEIHERIDELAHFANSLKEQKDNAMENSGSFRAEGMLYALEEINATIKSLNYRLGK